MTIYLAWVAEPPEEDLPGPWQEIRVAAPGLLLVDSEDTLSRVFHELKWSLPEDASLLVAPLAGTPKLRGLAAGTQSWLRDRLSPVDGSAGRG